VVIKFILKYSGDLLERFFIRVANEMNLKIGLKREREFLFIYVEGNQKEIEDFSNKLSSELPMSIFLNFLSAEVSDEFVDFLPTEFLKRNIPPCPRCLNEVKDKNNKNYYNPFHHCEICGYKKEKVEFKTDDYKSYFEEIAKKLKEGEVTIGTFNGKYKLTTDLKNVDKILAVDLNSVAKYFMSFEGDAKALASIEKPYLKLNTNFEFKKTFGILNSSYLVKLPDDMILSLLCEEVEMELIGLKEVDEVEFFDFEVKKEDELIAVVTDTKNQVIIPEKGDRLLPKFEKPILHTARNDKFIAIKKENKTILDYTDEKGTLKNPKYLAGFYGVLNMWDLENEITVGYSLYKEDESKILLNSPKFGLVEYLSFDFKYSSFEEIFALISAMDENGKKLIKNFSEKRKELFLNALESNLQTNKRGLFYLFGLIGIVLGFDKNIDKAGERLIEFSKTALTKKGPRIDYKMKDKNLNPLWAIRTAMSFNLAGVDEYLISYGVVESLAEFLNNLYETLKDEMDVKGAVLVGDLFEGEFLNKTYTYISKNYPTFIPKAVPISGVVEAYGDGLIEA